MTISGRRDTRSTPDSLRLTGVSFCQNSCADGLFSQDRVL